MSWRVARSLDELLVQIDQLAPNRSRTSDGSIGDLRHQRETYSDHNPDQYGVVRARDFTHDPARGANMAAIAEALRRSRDRRIKYVIFDRRIFSATTSPWTWRPYTGTSPHEEHMHVSVVAAAVADNDTPWEIGDDMPSLQEIREAVWSERAREYVDEDHDGIKDDRTVKDVLFAIHRAALAAADPKRLAVAVAAALPPGTQVTDEQLERVLRAVLGSLDTTG